jgi:excisionase family DNA binding protein
MTEPAFAECRSRKTIGEERVPNTGARYLTVSELSEYLKIHRTTLYRLLREGKLPGFRVGSDWRFSVDAIEQWQRDYMKTIPEGGGIDSPGAAKSPTERLGFGMGDSALEIPKSQPLPSIESVNRAARDGLRGDRPRNSGRPSR